MKKTMKKTLLLASGVAMALMAGNACGTVQPVPAPSYNVSEELYGALLRLDNLSDTDEAGTRFKIQIEDNETVTSYINPRGLALFSIGLALGIEFKEEFRNLLESYYADHPAERPVVTPEYNIPGGLTGVGNDLLLEIMHGMESKEDVQNFVGVNKETSSLRDHGLFRWAVVPALCNGIKLSEAAETGNLEYVQYMVEGRGDDINEVDHRGWTPLSFASDAGHLSVVEYLVNHGADVNKVSQTGRTPLSFASEEGHLSVVEYLVTHGADVNNAGGAYTRGRTPLSFALQRGHLSVIEYLLGHGASVDTSDVGYLKNRMLYLYAGAGDLKKVKSLVEEGVQINWEDPVQAPFYAAIQHNHSDIITYLLELHPYDSEALTSFLHHAASLGHLEALTYLIENGAQVDGLPDRERPLFSACKNNHPTVAEKLLGAGAKVDGKDEKGNSALHYVVRMKQWNTVKKLLEHGANPNEENSSGYPPLFLTAFNGDLEGVTTLVSGGADVDKANSDNRTPLYGASDQGKLPVVEYLVTHGADVNKPGPNGKTPLAIAAEKGHQLVVQYLAAHGAHE